jgi:hypothetical protein
VTARTSTRPMCTRMTGGAAAVGRARCGCVTAAAAGCAGCRAPSSDGSPPAASPPGTSGPLALACGWGARAARLTLGGACVWGVLRRAHASRRRNDRRRTPTGQRWRAGRAGRRGGVLGGRHKRWWSVRAGRRFWHCGSAVGRERRRGGRRRGGVGARWWGDPGLLLRDERGRWRCDRRRGSRRRRAVARATVGGAGIVRGRRGERGGRRDLGDLRACHRHRRRCGGRGLGGRLGEEREVRGWRSRGRRALCRSASCLWARRLRGRRALSLGERWRARRRRGLTPE